MKNILILILLVVLSNLLAGNVAVAQSYCDSQDRLNVLIKANHFMKVDDNYYRSGQPDDEDFKELAKLGVKTVINLRHPYSFNKRGMLKQKIIANRLGMNYFNIPMYQCKPPTQEQIDYFFSILSNPDNLPVFVHCWQGQDRTGLMTALYRVRCYHWNYDNAYTEMKSHGYHRFLYPRLKYFLRDYAKSYQLKNRTYAK